MIYSGLMRCCNRPLPNFGIETLSMLNRRQYLKNGLTLISTAGLAGQLSLLQGCSKSPSQSSLKTIRMAVSGRPQMLDPRKATDALSTRINRLIYRQLIDFDAQFLPKPDLATWQKLTPTHYRFTLRQASYFHHTQRRLISDDVIATYQSVLDKSLGSAHRGSLLNIESMQRVDDQSFDFYLKKPDALFVGRLVIGILPEELIQSGYAFHQAPVGSGDCAFVAQSAQILQLLRLHDQTTLEFLTVKDATVRVLKLRNQEVDLLQNDLSPELVNYAEGLDEFAVDWQAGTNFGYLGFNFEDPLLAKLDLRQAIAHGIDRVKIIDAIFNGQARLAQGLLVPEHWCGVQNMEDYVYRPVKAKQIIDNIIQLCLQETDLKDDIVFKKTTSGIKKPFLQLSFKTSNDPTRIRLATIYQDQLYKIGIDLKIQSYDWGTFYSDIKKGRFQLYSLAWVGVKSPDIFQYVFDSNAIPPKGANRGRFRDAKTDQLIAQAKLAQTISEQASLYKDLQIRLQEQLAAMPLWYENQYVVRSKRLQNYPLFSDGRYDGLLTATKTS